MLVSAAPVVDPTAPVRARPWSAGGHALVVLAGASVAASAAVLRSAASVINRSASVGARPWSAGYALVVHAHSVRRARATFDGFPALIGDRSAGCRLNHAGRHATRTSAIYFRSSIGGDSGVEPSRVKSPRVKSPRVELPRVVRRVGTPPERRADARGPAIGVSGASTRLSSAVDRRTGWRGTHPVEAHQAAMAVGVRLASAACRGFGAASEADHECGQERADRESVIVPQNRHDGSPRKSDTKPDLGKDVRRRHVSGYPGLRQLELAAPPPKTEFSETTTIASMQRSTEECVGVSVRLPRVRRFRPLGRSALVRFVRRGPPPVRRMRCRRRSSERPA